jgi:hypothetical protein
MLLLLLTGPPPADLVNRMMKISNSAVACAVSLECLLCCSCGTASSWHCTGVLLLSPAILSGTRNKGRYVHC